MKEEHTGFMRLEWSNEGFFNPSIMPLPHDSAYPWFAVARGKDKSGVIEVDNKRYKVRSFSYMVACFMSHEFKCLSNPIKLEVPLPIEVIKEHFRKFNQSKIEYPFWGAEDGKLFYTPQGAPMIIFGMNSGSLKNFVTRRTVWIADLRVLYPCINAILPRNYNAPITVNKITELTIPSDQIMEKNWIPFFSENKFLISYKLDPRQVLEWRQDMQLNSLSKIENQECIYKNPKIIKFGKINQGSNAVRISLCQKNDEKCIANPNSERFMSIVHFITKKRIYWHFTVTWQAKHPFQLLSVRKDFLKFNIKNENLNIKNENPDLVFPMTITTYNHAPPHQNDIYYLDTNVLISLGVFDSESWIMKANISELLGEQLSC